MDSLSERFKTHDIRKGFDPNRERRSREDILQKRR
jgi:hypothetical protein